MQDATQVKTIDDAAEFFNENICDEPIVRSTFPFKPMPYKSHLALR